MPLAFMDLGSTECIASLQHWFVCYFEIGSHSIAQAVLEFTAILLPEYLKLARTTPHTCIYLFTFW